MSEYIIECNYTYTDRNGKPCKEIVRCKDCAFCNDEGVTQPIYFCLNDFFTQPGNAFQTDQDGFCAWGERKSATELLPCPFCGGEARYIKDAEHSIYFVQCSDCGISSRCHSTEAEAAEAWNTRKERTCHVEETYHYDEVLESVCTILSCGHAVWECTPKFCPECGAKVVEQS